MTSNLTTVSYSGTLGDEQICNMLKRLKLKLKWQGGVEII